jgi:hypothetical protein
MADSEKKDAQNQGKPPANNDESIIDLIDEVSEDNQNLGITDLEKNLLELEDQIGRSLGEDDNWMEAEAPADLPEISDIDWSELEKAAADGAAAGSEGTEVAALDRLKAATGEPEPTMPREALSAPEGIGEVEDIAEDELLDVQELEEDFLEAEEIEDSLPAEALDELPAEDETDDSLELIEIEEEDTDNELVWFDELAAERIASEVAESMGLAEEQPASEDAGALFEEPAVFDAAAGNEELPPAPDASAAGLPLAAAALAAATTPGPPPDAAAPPEAHAAAPVATWPQVDVSPAQIEAAVERIINEKLAGRIETMIVQAIERAVTQEIERLKTLLAEGDAGDQSP